MSTSESPSWKKVQSHNKTPGTFTSVPYAVLRSRTLTSHAKVVYAELNSILKPMARVSQARLARQLGISPAEAKRAVLLLEDEGFITVHRHHGRPSDHEILPVSLVGFKGECVDNPIIQVGAPAHDPPSGNPDTQTPAHDQTGDPAHRRTAFGQTRAQALPQYTSSTRKRSDKGPALASAAPQPSRSLSPSPPVGLTATAAEKKKEKKKPTDFGCPTTFPGYESSMVQEDTLRWVYEVPSAAELVWSRKSDVESTFQARYSRDFDIGHYRGLKFIDFPPDMAERLRFFLAAKKLRTLLLYGPPGTTKSSLAACVLSEFRDSRSLSINRGNSVFTTMQDAEAAVTSFREDGEGPDRYIRLLADTSVLAFDDLTAPSVSGKLFERVTRALGSRYDKYTTNSAVPKTIITSNHTPDELIGLFGEPFVDRLNDGMIIRFAGASVRDGELPKLTTVREAYFLAQFRAEHAQQKETAVENPS